MKTEHVLATVLCAAAVTVSAFFTPLVGACGTAPYFMFRMFALPIREAVMLVWPIENDTLIEVVASVFYVSFFLGTAVLWYRQGPRRWFVYGLLGWTVFYIASYLFLLPTTSCL